MQAIFCDIAVNSDDGKFSVYDYIKEELVRRGVPEEEICAAGDAETQKQRNEMYAQLRSGTKRIVLASTSKMGTDANIQTSTMLDQAVVELLKQGYSADAAVEAVIGTDDIDLRGVIETKFIAFCRIFLFIV